MHCCEMLNFASHTIVGMAFRNALDAHYANSLGCLTINERVKELIMMSGARNGGEIGFECMHFHANYGKFIQVF